MPTLVASALESAATEANTMTWIERVFTRIVTLRPEMPDREVIARLCGAMLLFVPVAIIQFWRNATWTRPK